jgi:hypothetical protein
MLDSLSRLQQSASLHEAIAATMQGVYQRQQLGHRVHERTDSEPAEAGDWKQRGSRVEQLMSTDLITVRRDCLRMAGGLLRDIDRSTPVRAESRIPT